MEQQHGEDGQAAQPVDGRLVGQAARADDRSGDRRLSVLRGGGCPDQGLPSCRPCTVVRGSSGLSWWRSSWLCWRVARRARAPIGWATSAGTTAERPLGTIVVIGDSVGYGLTTQGGFTERLTAEGWGPLRSSTQLGLHAAPESSSDSDTVVRWIAEIRAMGFNPRVVVVISGANDVGYPQGHDVSRNVQRIETALDHIGGIPVVWTTISHNRPEWMAAWNQALRDVGIAPGQPPRLRLGGRARPEPALPGAGPRAHDGGAERWLRRRCRGSSPPALAPSPELSFSGWRAGPARTATRGARAGVGHPVGDRPT